MPRRAFTVLLLAILVAHITRAQGPDDRLRCLGGGDSIPSVGLYSLVVDKDRRLCVATKEEGDGTLIPCLRVGRVYVGQLRAEVEIELGQPWQAVEGQPTPTYAYPVFRDSTSRTGAYYIVEYERLTGEQIASAVQVTGDRPAISLQFSCLQLGDSEADVRRQLGSPEETTPFDSPEAGRHGMRWDYADPFSIEIVDGKVFSFRVWRPDDIPAKKRKLSLLRKP